MSENKKHKADTSKTRTLTKKYCLVLDVLSEIKMATELN